MQPFPKTMNSNQINIILDRFLTSFADAIVDPRSTTGTASDAFRLGLKETFSLDYKLQSAKK
jgi:hypothetical protein